MFLIRGELAKIPLLRIVELHGIYNFALESSLIRHGFQNAKLQSMVHETTNQFLDLENNILLILVSPI